MKRCLTIATILCVVISVVACSSPEEAGIKAAMRFKECDDDYMNNLTHELGNFVKKFDDYDFVTRVEARRAVEAIIDKETKRYEDKRKKAEKNYLELKSKYIKNREDAISFEYAYIQQKALVEQETLHGLPSQEMINEKILTIIPPKPEAEKIKADLVGRRFADKPDGYFSNKYFVIKEGEVENLEIRSAGDEKGRYKINAVVTLREHIGGVAFLVDFDILYMLGTADDWTIDGISANSISVVKENTELFRPYIKIEPTWTGYSVNIVNYSDALLLIAGILYNNGLWERFSIEVAGNNSYKMYCRDCEIHFIERR